MLSLNSYTGYRAYFENLATQHVDIAGFKYGDDKVVQNDSRKGLPTVFLHCLPYESARYSGPNIDQQYRRKRARYAILKVCPPGNFAAENEVLDFCEVIALQVNARMIYKDKPVLSVMLDVSSIEMKPVTDIINSTKYIGVEVGIDVMDNPGMSLNVNKWTDLIPPTP